MKSIAGMVSLLVLASGCGTQSGSEVPPESKTEPAVAASVSEEVYASKFRTGTVVGLLGHPLGRIVRVTGTAIDGDSTRRKGDQGKTLLKIETVNGETTDVSFTFEFLRARKGIEKPTAGEQFDYYVHEYGAFEGIVEPPPELNIEFVRMANDGFHYRPFITIHKSNN